MSKKGTIKDVANRDAQFKYINNIKAEFKSKNIPVLSVDTKKKEFIGKLYRNGEPYFVKGAGGYENFEKLKEYGGNSVRLWSTHEALKYLDKAQG